MTAWQLAQTTARSLSRVRGIMHARLVGPPSPPSNSLVAGPQRDRWPLFGRKKHRDLGTKVLPGVVARHTPGSRVKTDDLLLAVSRITRNETNRTGSLCRSDPFRALAVVMISREV